jgi:hypothetical protein
VNFQAGFQAVPFNSGGVLGWTSPFIEWGDFESTFPSIEWGGFGTRSLEDKTLPLSEGGGAFQNAPPCKLEFSCRGCDSGDGGGAVVVVVVVVVVVLVLVLVEL